jgi:tetratricopeptide (TPR) repeat protein
MKNLTITILILSFCFNGFGQDYKAKYLELSIKKDNDKEILDYLKIWENAQPNNAELYVAYFNYYFNKSRSEILHLETHSGPGENVILKDSTGKTAGFIYSGYQYNDSLFNLGQHYVDEGIKRNPRRLDLYFGKVYSWGEIGRFDKYQAELLKVIDLSARINYNWLWSDDKIIEDSKNHFKGVIQSYCNELFNLNPPKFDVIKAISQKMIFYFPQDIEYYSNIGSCYAMQGDYKKGLEYFKKAFSLNSKDIIVLNNLAYSYEQLKDYVNAIKFYNLVIKYGNDDDKKYAKQAVDELSKKK